MISATSSKSKKKKASKKGKKKGKKESFLATASGCSVSCGGGTQLWACEGNKKSCKKGKNMHEIINIFPNSNIV
jgi:hypothetical protein